MLDQEKQTAIVSLERGIEILRAFHADEATLSIHDIVRRTGLPKSTVARLTHTLVVLGYLEQTHFQGRYHLADSVLHLGHAVLANLPVCRIATPILQDLADRFQMTTAIGIGERADMVYLCYCRGREAAALRQRTGSLIPMHETTMGRAWLWALDPERRAHHLRWIEAVGADMELVAERLEVTFAQIDEQGYCTSLGDWRRDIFAAAVPFAIDNGDTVLSLNAGAPRQTINVSAVGEELGAAMKSASREIANTMAAMRLNFWNE